MRSPVTEAVLSLFAILACAVAVFLPVLRFGLVDYDDVQQLEENPLVRDLTPRGIAAIFSNLSQTSYYPVRLLSFAVDYRLWGLNATGYHATNLLLHLANYLLFLWLAWRLRLMLRADGGGSDAWRERFWFIVLAGVFVLHPIVAEPVAWISGREELLALFFLLCCLHAYVGFLGQIGGWPAYGLSLCFAVLACLSNVQAAVTAWIVTVLHVSVARRRLGTKRSLREAGQPHRHASRAAAFVAPFWLVAAACVAAKVLAQRWLILSGQPVSIPAGMGLPARLATMLRLYFLHVRSVLVPFGLGPLYPETSHSIVPDLLLCAGLLAGGGTAWLLRMSRANRLARFGLLWFLAGLLPSLQLVPHHLERADRFLYLALPGLVLSGIGAAVGRTKTGWRRVRGLVPAAVVLSVLGIQTHKQLFVWARPESFCARVLVLNPNSAVAHNTLGIIAFDRGAMQEAETRFRKALAESPRFPHALSNLGRVYEELGDLARAIECYAAALRVAPGFTAVQQRLARVEERDAIPDRKARHLAFLRRTASRLFARTRYDEAAGYYRRILAIEPGDELAGCGLVKALALGNRHREALDYGRMALSRFPDSATLRNDLAWILATSGQTAVRDGAEALRLAQRACALSLRANPQHLDTLAAALAESGRFPEAIAALREARLVTRRAGRGSMLGMLDTHLRTLRAGRPLRE